MVQTLLFNAQVTLDHADIVIADRQLNLQIAMDAVTYAISVIPDVAEIDIIYTGSRKRVAPRVRITPLGGGASKERAEVLERRIGSATVRALENLAGHAARWAA